MALILYITNACNFQCLQCLREYGKTDFLSLDLVKKIMPEIKRFRYKEISFTGGEPCLHPQFEEMVMQVVANDFKFGFISNGFLWEKYQFTIEKYKDNLGYMAISIDGPTQEIHDKIRSKGSFDKAIAAIKYFVSQGIYTNMMVCISQLNKNYLEDLVKLAMELGCKNVSFLSVVKTTTNQALTLSDREKLFSSLRISQLREKYPISILTGPQFHAAGGVDFCSALNNLSEMAVNPQGELILCCGTIREGAVLGSLNEKRFTELFCKGLEVAAELKKTRAQIIGNGQTITEGFNSCEFCNQQLEKFIK